MPHATNFSLWASGKTLFFSYKLKCWAPRISWLGTFWLLMIFLRPQPWSTFIATRSVWVQLFLIHPTQNAKHYTLFWLHFSVLTAISSIGTKSSTLKVFSLFISFAEWALELFTVREQRKFSMHFYEVVFREKSCLCIKNKFQPCWTTGIGLINDYIGNYITFSSCLGRKKGLFLDR